MNEDQADLRQALIEGQALVRIQDDQIQRIAVERPRNVEKVLEAALAEVELAPEFAIKNYYSIEYGRGDKATTVEGLSVRAAESLARLWGNCAVSSAPLEETEDRAVCVGTFLDYEAGFIRRETVRVSRIQQRREGPDVRLAGRAWATEIAKGCSIAARNATLRSLPPALQSRYWTGVRNVIAKHETPDEPKGVERFWAAVVYFVTSRGVSREQLEAFLGHPADVEHPPSESEVVRLRAARNAIEQGEADARDVFGVELERVAKVETPSGVGGLGGSAEVTRGAVRSEAPAIVIPLPGGDVVVVGQELELDPEEPERELPLDQAALADPGPVEPRPKPEASPWTSRGSCAGCGRHRIFVEHQGHGKTPSGEVCPHAI